MFVNDILKTPQFKKAETKQRNKKVRGIKKIKKKNKKKNPKKQKNKTKQNTNKPGAKENKKCRWQVL